MQPPAQPKRAPGAKWEGLGLKDALPKSVPAEGTWGVLFLLEWRGQPGIRGHAELARRASRPHDGTAMGRWASRAPSSWRETRGSGFASGQELAPCPSCDSPIASRCTECPPGGA